MITVTGLTFRTLAIPALTIPQGTTSVIGLNGCGKTTFLKLLAGIHLPEAGSVLIDGTPPRMSEIGWVNEFPDRNIIFCTAADEISSPLRFRHLPDDEIRTRTDRMMDFLGLDSLRDRPVRELSGGEKVMVALAAALITRPQVLIVDEFDSHMDARSLERIRSLLSGIPIPYIIRCTQDTGTAARGDYLIVLQEGRVFRAGRPDAVLPLLVGTPFYPFSWRCGYRTHAR